MSRIAIIAGAALIALGVMVTVLSDSESFTSLIPAFVGLVLGGLGLAARTRPGIAHHLMHAAAAVALMALLGSLGSLIGRGSEGWALVAQLGTVVVCGGFLALAVQSFRAARRARSSA